MKMIIDYPHYPSTHAKARLLRTLFLVGLVSVSVQAKTTNSIAALRRMRVQPRGLALKKRFALSWRSLQQDPDHVSSFFYDRFSSHNRFIRCNAASAQALALHYNYDEVVERDGFRGEAERIMSDFWMKWSASSRAIRNRKYAAQKLLVDSFTRVVQREGSLRVLSVASGSAEAVRDALKEFTAINPHVQISVLLADIDRAALRVAKKEFAELLPHVGFKTMVGDVFHLERAATTFTAFAPHVVEMMGIVDYVTDDEAPEIFSHVRAHGPLAFLTCNIVPNIEKMALHNVVMWPAMIYRRPEELARIVELGRFTDPEIYTEPFGVHVIARWMNV